jgi:hypothetical protein
VYFDKKKHWEKLVTGLFALLIVLIRLLLFYTLLHVALLNNFKAPVQTHHDALVHHRIRLIESRDKLSRFVNSLREIRTTLCDTYRETKGLKMPWTRYRMMTYMIKETIGAFQEIQTMKQLHDREEILIKHNVSDQLEAFSDIDDTSDDGDEVFENGVGK